MLAGLLHGQRAAFCEPGRAHCHGRRSLGVILQMYSLVDGLACGQVVDGHPVPSGVQRMAAVQHVALRPRCSSPHRCIAAIVDPSNPGNACLPHWRGEPPNDASWWPAAGECYDCIAAVGSHKAAACRQCASLPKGRPRERCSLCLATKTGNNTQNCFVCGQGALNHITNGGGSWLKESALRSASYYQCLDCLKAGRGASVCTDRCMLATDVNACYSCQATAGAGAQYCWVCGFGQADCYGCVWQVGGNRAALWCMECGNEAKIVGARTGLTPEQVKALAAGCVQCLKSSNPDTENVAAKCVQSMWPED